MNLISEEGGRQVWPCVSFLLVRDNTLLLETRRLDKVGDPGAIAIPGGHMEPGESQPETLARELEEELGVVAVQSWHLCSLYHPTPAELQLIHYHVVPGWHGEIVAAEPSRSRFTRLMRCCRFRLRLTGSRRTSTGACFRSTENAVAQKMTERSCSQIGMRSSSQASA